MLLNARKQDYMVFPKEWHINQWNRQEKPKIEQLIFDNGTIGKRQSFQPMV